MSTVFQEIRTAAGFKTGDFVKENNGGATVERLSPSMNIARTLLKRLIKY